MTMQNLDFIDINYRDEIKCHLRENIFHVTTRAAYERISKDGFIFNNKDDKYSINTGSAKSFGRHKGWVCLFDLRDKAEKEIEDALMRYYFLRPRWFAEYFSGYTEWNIVYLILSPECFQNLVPNEEAQTVWKTSSIYTQYVPKVECWYPGKLPLPCVQKILTVRIRENDPKTKIHKKRLIKKNK